MLTCSFTKLKKDGVDYNNNNLSGFPTDYLLLLFTFSSTTNENFILESAVSFSHSEKSDYN